MKANWLTLLIILFMALTAFSEDPKPEDKKYISVTGSAEVIVQPDEIELEIILREYDKAIGKVDLMQIENDFFKILKKHGIEKDKIMFNTTNSYYWYYWWTYRDQYHKQKRLAIGLDKATDFLSLIQDLDMEGVQSLRISKTSNKNLQALRKEVKIKAMQAAKDKAGYLLESIGEKAGSVITIEEVPDNANRHYWGRGSNMFSNVSIQQNATGDEIDNIMSIKLRYEIKAKFEIE